MSADNFTGQFISSTFQRLLQLSDNDNVVTDGTGSIVTLLSTTSSYALSSSYAQTAFYALNGGVTQLLAGPNITLAPTNGLGQVTVSATLSGSTIFNTATGSYGSFYSTSSQTNPVGNIPRSMSLNSTDITNGVSISGSTNPFNTYIKTQNAGIYNIQFSAQVEKTDSGTDEILIWLRKNGTDLTDTATTITLSGNNDKQVAAWNWFVTSAANDYYQIIWISADTGMRLLAETISATHPGIPSVIVTANRVDQFLSNTGSFTGSFTGNLIGTASWAYSSSQSLTSSFVTASKVFGPHGSSSVLSASFAISSSISSKTDTAYINNFIGSADNAIIFAASNDAYDNLRSTGNFSFNPNAGESIFTVSSIKNITVNIGDKLANDQNYGILNMSGSSNFYKSGSSTNNNIIYAKGSKGDILSVNDGNVGPKPDGIFSIWTGSQGIFQIFAYQGPPTMSISASQYLFKGLTTSSSVSNVLTLNPTTGQVYYTASSAIGGGGSTSPGGSPNQIQYNNAGAFGGISALTWNGSLLIGTGSFSGSFVGGLTGTSSWANTSSFAISSSRAVSASYYNIVAGPNITVNYGVNSVSISGSAGTGAPGGSNTQIQFNSQSAFAGTSSFTFNYQSQSLSHGNNTTATGLYSHAEGISSAYGQYAHSEGYSTAQGDYSHAEGFFTVATGLASHAEGNNTQTNGLYSHAEGNGTITQGNISHAEGSASLAQGVGSHAEGFAVTASGDYSHAEGKNTIASGSYSHAEGTNLIVFTSPIIDVNTLTNIAFDFGLYSVTLSSTTDIFVTGDHTLDPPSIPYTLGTLSVTDAGGTVAVNFAYYETPVISSAVYDGGSDTTQFIFSTPLNSTYQNVNTGNSPTTYGDYSHVEGYSTTTYGAASHAEGCSTIASGSISHAEGRETIAYGEASHAEGLLTEAIGNYSHAEGQYAVALGVYSHAEGANTIAYGVVSHAGGIGTIASGSGQTVVGQYNKRGNTTDLFVVGGGSADADANRKDILNVSTTRVVMSGSVSISGSLLVNGNTFVTNSQTSSMSVLSSSYAATASVAPNYVLNSATSSFITNNQTSSFVLNSQTSSMTVLSSSYAATASLAPNYVLNSSTSSFAKTGSNTFNGNQIISGSIIFAPPTSPSFNGEIVQFGAGTLTTGQLYFLSSSGTWSLANANSTGSSVGMLGLAVGTSPTTNGLLIRGFAASSSYLYGTGSVVYMATSSGIMTSTSPSSSNHVVRVVGYQTTLSNTIYFNPDPTWVTLV